MNNEIKSLDDKDFEVVYTKETKEEAARLEAEKIREGHKVADRIAKLLAKNAPKDETL